MTGIYTIYCIIKVVTN